MSTRWWIYIAYFKLHGRRSVAAFNALDAHCMRAKIEEVYRINVSNSSQLWNSNRFCCFFVFNILLQHSPSVCFCPGKMCASKSDGIANEKIEMRTISCERISIRSSIGKMAIKRYISIVKIYSNRSSCMTGLVWWERLDSIYKTIFHLHVRPAHHSSSSCCSAALLHATLTCRINWIELINWSAYPAPYRCQWQTQSPEMVWGHSTLA